jgi:uroporphyrinogen decarboxylase
MDTYSHRERIDLILAGERPDRFAASFWRHYFHREHDAEGTAEAMIEFQKEFDWDFVKINPRADYMVQDWGLQLEYSTDEFRKHNKLSFPVQRAEDWRKIQPLTPEAPSLAEHLEVVSRVRKALGGGIHIFMTLFTPLSLAGRLVSSHDLLLDHLRAEPEFAVPALEAITRTYADYALELRNAGVDGLFYATTHWASYDKMTWDEYQRFGVPYDVQVVQAAGDDALNILHVCAGNNFLRELSKYDYHSRMLNWDASDPTNVPLDKAHQSYSDAVLLGGVDHTGWLLRSEPQEMPYFIDQLKSKYDPSRLIIGPGCAVDPETNMDNLKAIRENL